MSKENHMTAEINETVARTVLTAVDAGLVKGVGQPILGQMCVEAAVCYALGLPHGDDPKCVSRALRSLKIRLNDSRWSSNEARGKGLRRLALVQLGSAGILDDKAFSKRVAELAIRKSVPVALRAAASVQKDAHYAAALRDAADRCEADGTKKAADAANAAAYAAAKAAAKAADAAAYAAADAAAKAADAAAKAADAAAKAADAANAAAYAAAKAAAKAADAADKELSDFAEGVVQILIDMKAPGVQWLYLTEVSAP